MRVVSMLLAQDVRQLCQIHFQPIKHPREQMAQIVREHLVRIDARLFAKRFHLPPDIAAVDGFSRACDKDGTGFDAVAFGETVSVASPVVFFLPQPQSAVISSKTNINKIIVDSVSFFFIFTLP